MNDLRKYGEWALVTGASSGIGKAYAEHLATQGLNLVLVARRTKLLNNLATEIENKNDISTKVISLDLSIPGAASELIGQVSDLNIGILISNAGAGYPGRFGSKQLDQDKRLLALNCETPMVLAHNFTTQFSKQGHGAIVFVSSMMGFQGVPFMAQYAATKSYSLCLAESLYHEYAGMGVDILAVAPGATDTPGKNLHDVDYSQLPIKWMTPEAVVESTFKNLGKGPILIPGKANKFATCLSSGMLTRNQIQKWMKKMAEKVISTTL